MEMADMDEIIATREHMSIPEIFASKGEAYFRTLETNLLRELQQKNNLIISAAAAAFHYGKKI